MVGICFIFGLTYDLTCFLVLWQFLPHQTFSSFFLSFHRLDLRNDCTLTWFCLVSGTVSPLHSSASDLYRLGKVKSRISCWLHAGVCFVSVRWDCALSVLCHLFFLLPSFMMHSNSKAGPRHLIQHPVRFQTIMIVCSSLTTELKRAICSKSIR